MSGLRTSKVFSTGIGLLVFGLLTSTCSSSSTPAPEQSLAPELWGDVRPVVSVKELMRDLIDPLADNVFDSVGVVIDAKGTLETEPRTDADWEWIRIGGVALAEGANLLKIRRPFAPPGDENDTAGPEAVELTPSAIEAKIEADPVEWNARIEALRNVGLQVLDIVRRKDVDELWDASENLDTACEACHLSYWYPGQTAAYWERLDRRLREYTSKSSDAPEPRRGRGNTGGVPK